MINIKLTAPVFKKNGFGCLEHKTDIQIAGDFNTFSEGYNILKKEVDEFLQQQQAEHTLLLRHDELQEDIASKEKTLQRINKSIELAREQLNRLANFLERLGINPNAYSLTIADKPIESSASVDAEVVDPIPFNLSDEDDGESGGEF